MRIIKALSLTVAFLIPVAVLAGLLGYGTTGPGGAAGVVLGLVAGGVAGWIAATRAAHA